MEVQRASYAKQWAAALTRDKAGFAVLVRKDPFENWESNRSPQGTAERLLTSGADVLFGDPAEPLGQTFVEQAFLVADRALAEAKEQSEACRAAYPLNRAQLRRARLIAGGILGQPIDAALAREAGDDFAAWCQGYGRRAWDSQAEAYLLAAVRMELIGGAGQGPGTRLPTTIQVACRGGRRPRRPQPFD